MRLFAIMYTESRMNYAYWFHIQRMVTDKWLRNWRRFVENCLNRLSKGGSFFVEKYRKVLTMVIVLDIIDS